MTAFQEATPFHSLFPEVRRIAAPDFPGCGVYKNGVSSRKRVEAANFTPP
jgi:hypothetical protein